MFADDEKEVPVFFHASSNASMTSPILRDTLQKMDEYGVTQQGTNADGSPFIPAILFDGHISCVGLDFLGYVNEDDTKWTCVLGVPYGTDLWQVHDDKRQNGSSKMALSDEKRKWFLKKRREHNLPSELMCEEVVNIFRPAIVRSFLVVDHAKKTLVHRGWEPFNRATLDDPQILFTAEESVQQECTRILNK